MNSSKLLVVFYAAVLAILAGHLSQSFTLNDTGKQAEGELKFVEIVGYFRMRSGANLDDAPPCKPCDGFDEKGCKLKCWDYNLTKSKCYGCMCLCEP